MEAMDEQLNRLRALEQAAQALLDVLDCTVNGTCVDCRRDMGNDEQHDEDCSVWRVSQLAHPA